MLTSLRVGLLLGFRQLQRANIWTTLLIIFIMMLTFLNLVAVSGILVGLIEGSIKANTEQYTGNVIVSKLTGEDYIENSQSIIKTIEALPQIERYSARYLTSGQIEANYRERRDPNEVRDLAGSLISGINPEQEDAVTHLCRYVAEGSCLTADSDGEILIGKNLLQRYAEGFGEDFATVEDVYPGDKVLLTLGRAIKEMTVKGVIDSKVNETSLRMFIHEREFRKLAGRTNKNVDEIALIAHAGVSDDELKTLLERSGVAKTAKIKTADEAIPQFLEDIKVTFNLLGTVIGGIGLVVASITIFIIIFINAITRQKYIGIMKGIGVRTSAILYAYLFQSLFYALAGALLGLLLIYAFLVPYFDANPLNFPFSDGILVAPAVGTTIRLVVLLVVTLLAGFIPAYLITRKNTLNSILGR